MRSKWRSLMHWESCQPAPRVPAGRGAGRASGGTGGGGDLVEQREGHVEHALERRLADALAALVVALGSVGEVGARKARRLEGIGVRSATGEDAGRLLARGRPRCLPGA